MYSLLTTSPFRLPNDLGPLTIYYQPPVEIIDEHGDPVLDAAGFPIYCLQPTIACAEQTTINAQFKRAKNYYESYMNIHWAVFNYLNDNIDNAFKVSNDTALVGLNPSMEPREIYDQITTMHWCPAPAALLRNDTLS